MRILQRAALTSAVVLIAALLPATSAHAALGPSAPCGPASNSGSDACTITTVDATNIRIDKPFVAGGFYEYNSVVFQPGDLITLNAGGCVQTGGSGDTWKRYVDPSGSDSDRLYFGKVSIPGARFTDNPNRRLDDIPFRDILLGPPHKFFIPYDVPTDVPAHIDLRLDYTDDEYGDNGYYRHDDGNDDQCALDRDGGPAWVTVSVQHNVTGPWPSVRPLAWDVVGSGYDSNLLFKNPAWGWQVNGGTVGTDGDYFDCVWNSIFGDKTPCHAQDTTFDHIGWDLWGALGGIVDKGLCGEDAFTGGHPLGHENWFDVAYNGTIQFDEWSGNIFGDDDINMLLTTGPYGNSGNRGVTDHNPDKVKLEFDSDETIDNFDADNWWLDFHRGATGIDPRDILKLHQMTDGHDAVVIGLMGLDTEHDSTSEIHPVHALAIRESAGGSVDPAHDRWAIFARNWGNEGECGSLQHFLNSTQVTLDLPSPAGVPATAKGNPVIGQSTFHAHGTSTGPAIHPTPGNTQITFTLPAGSDKPFVVGQVELNWTGSPGIAPAALLQNPATAAAAAPASAAAAEDDAEEGDAEAILAEIGEHMTPEQQQTAAAIYEQLRAHTRLATIPVTPLLSTSGPAVPAAVPGVSTGPDPIALQRIHAQFQALCAATGGNLPTQPAWCPSLNQPPVTTLNIAGGAGGPDGWLTTRRPRR